jgi:hypothetical protein
MEAQILQDFSISQMRALDMPGMTFFYATSKPVLFANLDKVLDPLLDSLYQARQAAPITSPGPDIVRYYKMGEGDLYQMEVGIQVPPGTKPAGAAQVKLLPPYPCAALLLWGSLAHIVQAYVAMGQAMEAAGLQHNGEVREITYYFQSVDSPNNLMGIFMGVGDRL